MTRLLRRHVGGRAHGGTGAREAALHAGQFRQTEICYSRTPAILASFDQDVGRLEIAMEDAVLVRVLHGERHVVQPARGETRSERLTGDDFVQGPSVHDLHDEERNAVSVSDFVNGDEIRMLQPRGDERFVAKARTSFTTGEITARQGFDRDEALQGPLARAPDHAHSAAADLLEQLVVAEQAQRGTIRPVFLRHAERTQPRRRADRQTRAADFAAGRRQGGC